MSRVEKREAERKRVAKVKEMEPQQKKARHETPPVKVENESFSVPIPEEGYFFCSLSSHFLFFFCLVSFICDRFCMVVC